MEFTEAVNDFLHHCMINEGKAKTLWMLTVGI
jgi:hypothetical protein